MSDNRRLETAAEVYAEIDRLTAELAAEREAHTETALALGRVDAERDEARAALAAERERVKHLERVVGCHDLLKQNADALTDNDRLRAELAAEREGGAQYKREWETAIDELAAERERVEQWKDLFSDEAAAVAKLREALVKAREGLVSDYDGSILETLDAIDAILKETEK
jgi:hypothetical protein